METKKESRLFVHGCTYVAEHMDVRERPAANKNKNAPCRAFPLATQSGNIGIKASEKCAMLHCGKFVKIAGSGC